MFVVVVGKWFLCILSAIQYHTHMRPRVFHQPSLSSSSEKLIQLHLFIILPPFLSRHVLLNRDPSHINLSSHSPTLQVLLISTYPICTCTPSTTPHLIFILILLFSYPLAPNRLVFETLLLYLHVYLLTYVHLCLPSRTPNKC